MALSEIVRRNNGKGKERGRGERGKIFPRRFERSNFESRDQTKENRDSERAEGGGEESLRPKGTNAPFPREKEDSRCAFLISSEVDGVVARRGSGNFDRRRK